MESPRVTPADAVTGGETGTAGLEESGGRGDEHPETTATVKAKTSNLPRWLILDPWDEN